MLVVYKIRKNDETQHFLPEDPADREKLMSACVSKSEAWTPVRVYNAMPLLARTDFYQWDEGYLIASAAALSCLGGFFAEAGEVLPVDNDGETYWLVNVLNCVDCLEHEHTEFDQFNLVRRASFLRSCLPGPGLFKIPETRSTAVYVLVDCTADETQDFKGEVERAGLMGIRFVEVWRGIE